jgi:hypothetical protein
MNGVESNIIAALFPNARGFAYVVFEDGTFPIDWGISDVAGGEKAERCLCRLNDIIDRYRPNVLLLRDARGLRARRTVEIIEASSSLAESWGVDAVNVSSKQVREAFAQLGPRPTRYARAEAIIQEIPMFGPYLPPVRKIWKGEDRRMGLFDAAGLAITFLKSRNLI